jgi:putative nucleotidyltransferase-like protein
MLAGAEPAPEPGDLAAVLRGAPVPWPRLGVTPEQLLTACARQDLTGLLSRRLSESPAGDDWPAAVRDGLRAAVRDAIARELVRRREIVVALAALARAGVRPILIKGTALAYSVYPEPMARPRVDTDLLVRRDEIEAARGALLACGYAAPLQCDGEMLFRQFALTKTDAFGVEHMFDVHWKISTQTLFADLVTYEELDAEAVPVGSLGPDARMAGPVHALLLACVHPAMHHRNVEWLLWVYDVHLLASRLSRRELDRLADLATARHVAAIVAQALTRARVRFGTSVPDQVIARLAAAVAEPSAAYLRAGRRWHDELSSNLRALPTWRDRVKLLGEVLVPAPGYMRARYRDRVGGAGALLLPALYAHRALSGVWKVLTGRK